MADFLRTLIVDDEAPARRLTRKLLAEFCDDVYVCAEAANVDDAVATFNQFRPDLILLDIDLKGGSGFQVLERIDLAGSQVVFLTAYEQHAIRALRAAATDYLVKPLDVDHLESAIARTLSRRGANALHTGPRVVVPTGQHQRVLAQAEILYLEADRSYTTIYTTGGEQLVISRKLGVLEEGLTPHSFVRVHRSYIVNLGHVRHFGSTSLTLRSGTELPVSRGKTEQFRKRVYE